MQIERGPGRDLSQDPQGTGTEGAQKALRKRDEVILPTLGPEGPLKSNIHVSLDFAVDPRSKTGAEMPDGETNFGVAKVDQVTGKRSYLADFAAPKSVINGGSALSDALGCLQQDR